MSDVNLTDTEREALATVRPESEWDYDPERLRVETEAVVERIVGKRIADVRAAALAPIQALAALINGARDERRPLTPRDVTSIFDGITALAAAGVDAAPAQPPCCQDAPALTHEPGCPDRVDAAPNETTTDLAAENAALRSLLEPFITEQYEDGLSEVEREVANVRCLRCGLRYEERQEYGCREEARAHDYDEEDLAAARRLIYPGPRTVDEALAEARAAVPSGHEQEGDHRGNA